MNNHEPFDSARQPGFNPYFSLRAISFVEGTRADNPFARQRRQNAAFRQMHPLRAVLAITLIF
jgi:hypothetical protein